jgi:putative ABC transport system ATP-binding protein
MALIECTDLTKTYRLGDDVVKALDGVTLTIDAGDFVAIAGPSGSGKSTLANVIGGLDRPDSGQVMVNGMNLATAKDKQLSAYRNSNVGFVFQSFNLQVHETALENVISPLVIGGVGRRKERRLARKGGPR